MNQGEDLTLGMLSEDNYENEDFVLDNSDVIEEQEPDIENKDKDKDIISEENKTPESVADKDKETPVEAKPSPGSDNKMSQIYSSLAAHLNETGVLPSLNLEENKINSVEDLQNAIKSEIDNSISERQRAYEKAVESGEPVDEYVKHTNQMAFLDKITDESLESTDSAELRFNLIGQDFLNKGFSKEDAIKYAKRSQDLGEDIEDAKSALERIKEFNINSYKKSVEEKQKLEKQNVDKIKDFVNNTDEIIKGIKLTPTTKEELLKQMTTAVGRDEKGNPLTKYGEALTKDPVKTKAITEYMFLLTKGFTDFSKINNIIGSKATKNIDEVLRNTGGDFINSGKVNFNNNDEQSSFLLDDEFNIDI